MGWISGAMLAKGLFESARYTRLGMLWGALIGLPLGCLLGWFESKLMTVSQESGNKLSPEIEEK
jgi:ABC-type nitrate/sulfonate/bicarbonate transport system permease component